MCSQAIRELQKEVDHIDKQMGANADTKKILQQQLLEYRGKARHVTARTGRSTRMQTDERADRQTGRQTERTDA